MRGFNEISRKSSLSKYLRATCRENIRIESRKPSMSSVVNSEPGQDGILSPGFIAILTIVDPLRNLTKPTAWKHCYFGERDLHSIHQTCFRNCLNMLFCLPAITWYASFLLLCNSVPREVNLYIL